jgi:hypothetical protein
MQGGDKMTDKNVRIFIKKFNKSLRTHLCKNVIFSNSFKNGGKHNLHNINKSDNNVIALIMILSSNSKCNIREINEIVDLILSVRTFKDLNITHEKNKSGLRLCFYLDNLEYHIDLTIYMNTDFSDQKMIGYETTTGIKFVWADIIDYKTNPEMINEEYNKYFHQILVELIAKNKPISNEINWTSLVLSKKLEQG